MSILNSFAKKLHKNMRLYASVNCRFILKIFSKEIKKIVDKIDY